MMGTGMEGKKQYTATTKRCYECDTMYMFHHDQYRL
jgi:hypothetical protein